MARTDRRHVQKVRPDRGRGPVAPLLRDEGPHGPRGDPHDARPTEAELEQLRPDAADLERAIEDEAE